MNRLWMAPLSLGLLCSSYSYAAAVENGYPQGMDPAMLMLQGKSAVVHMNGHKQYLTINNVNPLVVMTRSLGKNRKFNAFSINAYQDSWNSCNVMKDKLNLWHADNFNAYLAYAVGPNNGQKAKYQTNSPLYTSKDAKNPKYSTGETGAIPIRLHHAELNKKDKTVTFEVLSGAPQNGVYNHVALLTECINDTYVHNIRKGNTPSSKPNHGSPKGRKASPLVETKH